MSSFYPTKADGLTDHTMHICISVIPLCHPKSRVAYTGTYRLHRVHIGLCKNLKDVLIRDTYRDTKVVAYISVKRGNVRLRHKQ